MQQKKNTSAHKEVQKQAKEEPDRIFNPFLKLKGKKCMLPLLIEFCS
jgi:hypothetical protein